MRGRWKVPLVQRPLTDARVRLLGALQLATEIAEGPVRQATWATVAEVSRQYIGEQIEVLKAKNLIQGDQLFELTAAGKAVVDTETSA